MRVLAALLSGLFFYLLVAYLTGNGPRFDVRRSPTTQVSHRQLWLIQAGSDLTPSQFRAGSIAASAITFVLFLFLTGAWWIALVPAVVVGLWPRAYYRAAATSGWPSCGEPGPMGSVTSSPTSSRAPAFPWPWRRWHAKGRSRSVSPLSGSRSRRACSA